MNRSLAAQIFALLTADQKRRFYALVVVNIVAAAVEVIGVLSLLPFLMLAATPSLARSHPHLSWVYEHFGFSNDASFLIAAGAATLAALFITNAFGVFSLWYRTHFCTSVVSEMSDRLFRGYLSQPYSYFLHHNSAVLGKDLLNEANSFYSNVLEPLTIVIARGLQVVCVAVALMLLNWKMATFAALLFGGFYLLTSRLLMYRVDYLGSLRWESNESRYRLAAEALGGMKEVRLFGREEWYGAAFDDQSRKMNSASGRLAIYGLAPRYLIELLISGSLILVVMVAAARGRSFVSLVPTLGVFATAGIRLLPSIQLLFQYASTLRGNRTVVERLSQRFAEVSEGLRCCSQSADQTARLPLNHALTLHEVGFAYSSDGPRVLDDVSLSVPAGGCVGICGPSGAGKTTIMDIALALLSPISGTVKVDGADLTAANSRAWHRNIGYVPQAIYLIDGTIAENIAFGSSPAAIDRLAVKRAAELANLGAFVNGLKEGYETQIGERGIRLSGGQRQRIAIARALYHAPDVLFFDEATSALDAESEASVVDAIQSLAHKKTIVIVAHRHSTLRYCDVIYEIRGGKVARSCTYEELVGHAAVGG